MAIVFDENGKYVDEKGLVKLDPTKFADWQIAEEAEKTLPPVEYFREKLSGGEWISVAGALLATVLFGLS